jgi:hypothetical protein
MMRTKQIRVAAYARQVFSDDLAGTDVAHQLAKCRKLFVGRRAKKILSADVYLEPFTNGPLDKRRAFGELREHIQVIGLDEIFVYSMDCISHDPLEVSWAKEFLARHEMKLRVALEQAR